MHPELAPLQRKMLKAITAETPSEAAIVPVWHGAFHVYAEAWFIRLHESLADDFPAVARVLGPSSFEHLIRRYLKAHPPRSHTLAHAGDSLPAFLGQEHPWLGQLAQLECFLYQAFHAADPIPWDLAALQGLSEEKMGSLKIMLSPAARILQATSGVFEVWSGERDKPQEISQIIIIYREGFQPQAQVISADEFEALTLARQGTTLGKLSETCPSDRFVAWMSRWSAEGIIAMETK